jgi:rubrerythrin
MGHAVGAERIHASMYAKAKRAVDGGRDVKLGTVQVCANCGHTLEGDEPPDRCPICKVPARMYRAFA